MRNSNGQGAGNDLDEVRRLLYMADLRLRTDKYELAGTLVNALVHHQAAGDPAVISEHVIAVIEGGTGEEAGRSFLRDQIARITTELGQ